MKPKIDRITHMIVHHVGNKSNGEGVGFSDSELDFASIEPELLKLVERSFNQNDLYHFYYEGSVALNPVFSFTKEIFKESGGQELLYTPHIHPSRTLSAQYIPSKTVIHVYA